MTADVATRPTAEQAPTADVRRRWVVLLPDFVKGLHHLPPSDVAGGAHDPQDLWPRNAWGAAVRLAGSTGVQVAVVVTTVLACAWSVRSRRRP